MLFAACATLYTSCTEDEDPSIIGTWKFTGAIFNPAVTIDSMQVTDAFSMFFPDACDQDDYIMFQENGVQINDEGALLCNISQPQRDTASYSFSGGTLMMFEEDGDTTGTITNITITETSLTGKWAIEFGEGTTNIDVTLTRQ